MGWHLAERNSYAKVGQCLVSAADVGGVRRGTGSAECKKYANRRLSGLFWGEVGGL